MGFGTVPSRNPILIATDGMQIHGYGLSSLSDAKNREVRDNMTEIEAIEELKYDCNKLGKAIPCDTSWGSSFENAYEMLLYYAIQK